jgi:hypothetical protein
MNPDIKANDGSATFNVTDTMTINVLSDIDCGTDSLTRIGNDINPKSILLRYNLTAIATHPSFVRVLLFQDKHNLGTANPTASDIFSATAAAYVTVSPLAYKFTLGDSRFKVLADHTVALNDSYPLHHQEVQVPLKGVISFIGPNAADSSAGTIYVVFVSSSTYYPAVASYYARLTYTD